jgi:tetratricopeptide (TPR) repeat protein
MGLWFLVALLLGPAPGDDPASHHAARAAAAMKSGNYQVAETHYRELVRLRPDMPEALVNLGLSCYLQKKYVEAAGHFETGLKNKPDMANASLFLGLARFHLNRPAEAAVQLERYVATRADDFQGVYFLGLSYLALEQFDKAETLLAAARQIQPRNPDVLYHMAQVQLARARANPQAAQTFGPRYEALVKELASADPDSVRLAQLRAGFLEASGKKAEAIQELEAAVATRPKIRGLHYTLGCLYLEALRYDSAIEQFQLELELDSPFPRTYLQLAHAYINSNRPQQALPHLETAVAMEPRDAGLIWLEMARARRALDQLDAAIIAYQKAIAAGQRDASVYYQLSIVAKRAGKEEIAREALSTSEKLRKQASK